MFKWIFLAQAVIYLFLMPTLHRIGVIGYYPPIGAGALATMSLIGGFAIYKLTGDFSRNKVEQTMALKLAPQAYLAIAIPVLSILYCSIVVAFGLLNRRQGSEYMAELYASLPLYALAILRIYEIWLIPILAIYLFGSKPSKIHRYAVFLSIILTLPFTGIADSRSRLLLIALFIVCMVSPKSFISFFTKYIRIYIALGLVLGAFLFYSIQRSRSYSSVNEYLLFEVYQRLDGLNLVTDLRDSGAIDKIGQYDFAMFAPFISKIPVLDAAREAKMMGLTSTKQYFLQSILGRSQLDTPNSMISDPLYFAGWLGIIIAFLAIGYCIAKFDSFIKAGRLMISHKSTALAIAFVTSFSIIENDLFASVIALLQNYIFTFVLLAIGTRHVTSGSKLSLSLSPADQRNEPRSVAIVQRFQ